MVCCIGKKRSSISEDYPLFSSSTCSFSKNIGPMPEDIFREISVNVVYMNRSRTLNHVLFQLFYEEMGQQHSVLLYLSKIHCDVDFVLLCSSVKH